MSSFKIYITHDFIQTTQWLYDIFTMFKRSKDRRGIFQPPLPHLPQWECLLARMPEDQYTSVYLISWRNMFLLLIAGSMFQAMFSGRFDTKASEDGSYFTDRDGTHFRYILNYLRTGELIVPNDEIIRRELLAEAKYYHLEEMIN